MICEGKHSPNINKLYSKEKKTLRLLNSEEFSKFMLPNWAFRQLVRIDDAGSKNFTYVKLFKISCFRQNCFLCHRIQHVNFVQVLYDKHDKMC